MLGRSGVAEDVWRKVVKVASRMGVSKQNGKHRDAHVATDHVRAPALARGKFVSDLDLVRQNRIHFAS
jgi:hypothetical protein